MQSPRPDAARLARRRAAPPIAAEVCLDVFCAYCAHARAEFSAYGCIPKLDIINILCLDLPTVFYFLLGCCSLENRKDQLSSPCLRLSQR